MRKYLQIANFFLEMFYIAGIESRKCPSSFSVYVRVEFCIAKQKQINYCFFIMHRYEYARPHTEDKCEHIYPVFRTVVYHINFKFIMRSMKICIQTACCVSSISIVIFLTSCEMIETIEYSIQSIELIINKDEILKLVSSLMYLYKCEFVFRGCF